jgi:hypothetical protein
MSEGFSVFGQMDLDTISDDPWAVENNWYFVRVTKSYFTVDDEGQNYWHVVYSIFEPDSKYHGRPLRERFMIFPDYKPGSPDSIPAELEPEQVTQLEKLKQRMTKGLGLKGQELAYYSTHMEELIGEELYVKVKNNPGKVGTEYEGETFINITDAKKEMPGAKKDATSASIGL